jgi:cytochrome c oxidase subunit 2
VAGFGPIMPTFQGQISEDQLVQLIAFIKSLQPSGQTPATAASPAPGANATPAGSPTRNIR